MKKIVTFILFAILAVNPSYAEESKESLFEQAKKECINGSNPGCGLLGSMYVEGKDVYDNNTPQNIPVGIQLLTTSCNVGELSACLSLGEYYKNGKYIQEDKFKAAKIFNILCSGGQNNYKTIFYSSSACLRLGFMTESGEGVPKNKDKALALYNKACALGSQDGCHFARGMK